ncbi:MAG: sugar phosphate isomerase/epimerase [Peptococcaceae bacterium]|jgi:sugar phosphate isomerase/epimerase|nr:sugar phosphate isomerase/epimerase [Peptococcaceae bacterium]
MKLGMSLYSFGADIHAGRMDVYDAIRCCAEMGCDGVEIIGEQHIPGWPNPSLDDLKRIRELVASLSMEIFCFSCYFGKNIRSDRPQTQEEMIHNAKKMIAVTACLGAKIMRPAFNADPVDILVDYVNAVLPALEEYGVIWGVELHAPHPPAYYLKALETVNSPWFRLVPDFSCWQGPNAPGQIQTNELSTLEPLLPYAVHCHGKAHMFDENGEEPNTPYKEIFTRLKDYGFEGSVAGEFEGWLMNGEPSTKTTRILFNLLEKYGR